MRNTLHARLITLMVISSIFLVSVFTTIQLYNQLKRSAESNLYRANIGAVFTKDKLQRLFTKFDRATPPSVVKDRIKDIFLSELQSRIIDNAVLIDGNGTPLISEGKTKTTFGYDKALLGEIYQARTRSQWLFPVVDKKNKTLNYFILPENPYGYFVHLSFSLGNLKEALSDVYNPVLFTIAIVIAGNIILATLLSRTLVSPVKMLNEATKDIAKGDLDRKVTIHTDDELEELAGTFNFMTLELKRMRARAENANPLTKLPGNIVIQEEVDRRIKDNEKFTLIYCDLDNFKAFNDKYGVHAGDKAIMSTAKALTEAAAKYGSEKDFVGHEGGDDFLLLTSPDKADLLAANIIKAFDEQIRAFYSKEDVENGYIEAASRDSGKTIKYPIMTISIVGVSNTRRNINSYSQITNIAAELKKAAKKIKKSNFLIDKRGDDRGIGYRGEEDEKDDSSERRGSVEDRRDPADERRGSVNGRRNPNER